MIRAFSPRDIARLRRRQVSGASLDLEGRILSGRSPLQHAIGTLWPGRRHPYHTWLLEPVDGSFPGGCAQARRRRDTTEADLTFIAPALSTGPRAVLSWQRLLPEACQGLAACGVTSIFAAIDADEPVALQVLRRLGFADLAHETVYRLAAPHPIEPAEPIATRAPQPSDGPALDRLARSGLASVDRAGSQAGEWDRHPLGGQHALRGHSRVWIGSGSELLGAWRLCEGSAGRWLSCLTAEGAGAATLVGAALAAAGTGAQPLFAAARSDQAALHDALRARGFEPFVDRIVLVKHNALRVIEPAWREQQTLEGSMEAAPSRFSPPLAAQVDPSDARPGVPGPSGA
ncbi:MAG: hypothetical protein KDH92_00180 [Chloroflexi bacterium]|nr:hypothetical protein [Chloroflexota bacterium]